MNNRDIAKVGFAVLAAVMIYTFMNHGHFYTKKRRCFHTLLNFRVSKFSRGLEFRGQSGGQ